MPNLVGIGNSQAPTNAMLGGLAYQDSVGEIDIEKIKARTGDTATAIFVYDTSKDSDGGAWRKKANTQSWYNEGVNQYRGARKEFPAVAVIVAATSPAYQLTIYDGDDPNMPLWMKWYYVTNDPFLDYSTPGSHHLGNYAPKSISAMNGIVCVGTLRAAGTISNLNAGIREFHFIKDECFATNNDKRVKFSTSIADRNVVTTGYKEASSESILDSNVHDVAMTVQPNAPIDEYTGLPIPTIAVGTHSGMSIITNNPENSKSIVHLSGFNPTTFAEINEKGVIGALGGTSTHDFIFKTNIPTSNEQFDVQITAGSGNYYMNSNSGTTPLLRDLNMTAMTFNPSDTTVYRGGNNGFDIITNTETVSGTANNSLIAYVDTDYNSGYMHGDIKGAFLSSTDATNVTGAELITNPGPNFSNTSGWGATNGSLSVSSNDLLLTGANNVNEHMYSTGFTLTSGKTYVLSVDSNQIFSYCRIGTDIGLTSAEQLDTAASPGVNSFTFTATATGTFYLKLGMVTSYVTGSINSASLRLAELDRSLNDKGLQVFGTVTKSAVATGAELVAYSGFSGSNYLVQPYNSDLDFTNSMSIMLWVNGWVGSDTLLHRGPGTVRNEETSFHLYCSYDYNYRFTLCSVVLDGDGDTVEQTFEIPLYRNQLGWQHLCFTLSGATVRGFLNGVEQTLSSNSFTGTNIFSQATNKNGLYIGTGPVGGAADTASLALLKLSATVPSADQVKKIYADEKCLFHENSKCTISGATSAVTALGFDDSTDTAYVGTASGRSDFRGLNRINNTTTAVTTAISASNELVAEQ